MGNHDFHLKLYVADLYGSGQTGYNSSSGFAHIYFDDNLCSSNDVLDVAEIILHEAVQAQILLNVSYAVSTKIHFNTYTDANPMSV